MHIVKAAGIAGLGLIISVSVACTSEATPTPTPTPPRPTPTAAPPPTAPPTHAPTTRATSTPVAAPTSELLPIATPTSGPLLIATPTATRIQATESRPIPTPLRIRGTPTPIPSPTVIPTPTPTTPGAKIFNGFADHLTPEFELEEGLVGLSLRHVGSGKFVVEIVSDVGGYVSSVEAVGDYSGMRAHQVRRDTITGLVPGPYHMRVQADGRG